MHAGANEELDVITESMNLLRGRALEEGGRARDLTLRRVDATALSAVPAGGSTMTDALSAKARKPSPGLEGVKACAGDPRFATGLPLAPLS